MAQSQSNKSAPSNPAAEEGLALIASDNLEFQGHLSKMLDPETIDALNPVLPKTFIIINNTGRYIYSFTVVYRYVNRLTESGAPSIYKVTKTAMAKDNRAMIAPGDLFFITPLRGVAALFNPDLSSRRTYPILDDTLRSAVEDYKQQGLPAEAVQIEIDSVTFDDGTLVGPDTTKRLERMNGRTRAQDDIFAYLDGQPDNEVTSRLTHLLDLPIVIGDKYMLERRHYAWLLMKVAEQDGPAAAVSLARDFYNKKQIREIRRKGDAT